MRAIMQDRYGPPAEVLRVADIEPPEPGPDEVLVRPVAASIHPDVWHVVTGHPLVLRLMGAGLRRPKEPVPGIDVAGVVEAVGTDVTLFQPGDEVFGETVPGMQWRNGGAFAELVAAPEAKLETKPERLSFEEAAAVPTAGLIAMANLGGHGRDRSGRRVLVNGAGGGVGHLVVQLAHAQGAQVTAVDTGPKLEAIRALGADRVVDFRAEDFTQGDERYDLIVDIPGNHRPRDIRSAIAPGGRYVLVGHDGFGTRTGRWLGTLPRMASWFALALLRRQRVGPPRSTDDRPPLTILTELIEQGKVRPVVDRTYPLEDVVDALDHLASGTVVGKVVLTL